MKLTSSTMARSDSEDVYEVTEGTGGTTLMKLQNLLDVDDTVLDKPNDRTIHSGHFMVSHAHEEGEEADEAVGNRSGYDLEVASPGQSPGGCGGGGGVVSVPGGCKSASCLVIDGSLAKLFKCMTLAHCSTLTSPKWRNFKGINVKLKDKIRLNNIIWREWHMQYIKGAPPIVCHFETPVSSKNDGRLEYWKLRMDSLKKEYKCYSRFFPDRFSMLPDDHELLTRLSSSYYASLQRVSQSPSSKMSNPSLITVPMFSANDSVIMDDDAINDIFGSMFMPYGASRGNPSNYTAQTSLEEFMDTLEPLPPPIAIDFRGFGRLSSNTSGCSSAIPANTMKVMFNPVELGGMCSTTVTMQPNQSLPSVSSQALSFGSAEELLALLQSQMASESSLEYLITDPSSLIGSSGYSSGATIQSGFPISDGNLALGTDDLQMMPNDGIDMQEFPGDETTSQMCSMFFLPETGSVSTGQPIFTQVNDTSTSGMVSYSQLLDVAPSCMTDKSLQLLQFLQAAGASQEEISTLTTSRALSGASASLPRLKSSHDLIGVGRASQSLGSIQANKGFLNMGSSTGVSPQPASGAFRVPQKNTGARPKYSTSALPQLQPKQQVTSVAMLRQEMQQAKQGTTIILPKQSVQQPPSTSNWSLQGNERTDYLTVPMAEQYSFGQDAQLDSGTAEANQPLEAKRRVRHKSDQSSASRGTTIRPIAVFQPINPLQTKSTGRSSSKGNCSVSFSLDKNTAISPSPVSDSPAMQMNNLPTNVMLTTSGPTVAMSTNQITDTTGTKAFRENLSCPGIFDSSSQSCDFSDILSLNSSSARSRHTSNESTSSHYDELGGRTLLPKPEVGKQTKELRRVSHITAEQKRRSNIKCGFDTLIHLIPELKESPNSRVSKATALHKAAEMCRKLKQERLQKHDEVEQLRNEIKALEADISTCQLQLPATGAPPVTQPVEQLNDRFEEYICKRTLDNWKYFIFGSIAQPLLKSFEEDVTRGSSDQLRKSVLGWLQSHCSLASLRPLVTNALVNLSIKTSILSDPSLVPEEVRETVRRQRNSQR